MNFIKFKTTITSRVHCLWIIRPIRKDRVIPSACNRHLCQIVMIFQSSSLNRFINFLKRDLPLFLRVSCDGHIVISDRIERADEECVPAGHKTILPSPTGQSQQYFIKLRFTILFPKKKDEWRDEFLILGQWEEILLSELDIFFNQNIVKVQIIPWVDFFFDDFE